MREIGIVLDELVFVEICPAGRALQFYVLDQIGAAGLE